MKKFTKAMAVIISAIIIVASFASCGLIEDTANVERVNNLKKTVLTVDGDIEITGAYYGWYYSNAYNNAYSAASAELEADSSADSSAEIKVDIEAVKKEAQDNIVATKMACKKAAEAGIELTGTDYQNISSQVEQYRSSMLSSLTQQGMSVSYNDYLSVMNTNADAVNQIFEDEYLASLYYATSIKDDYVTAKHILVKYDDGVHTKEEAQKLISDIKAELDSGADFDKLMKEKSEDKSQTGAVNSPEGYTFTNDGSMVPEFEAAAFALSEGEVSAPVEVQSEGYNGFHILNKIPTSLSGVAMNVTQEIAASQRDELIANVKVEEAKLIEYFAVEY